MARVVVDDVLVNLVGNGERVPPQAQLADKLQLFARKDFPGRVVGGVYNDGLSARAKGCRKFVAIKFPVGRMEPYEPWAGA